MTNPANDPAAGGDSRAGRSNFIRDIIDADLAAGRHVKVVTRFPPEPNGFLHIGHSKAICLNFGIAADYRGRCNLRFDDTNPLTEKESFVRAIERDVAWLGFEWGDTLFASDYFEGMYDCAVTLIRKGLAYVDSQTQDEIAAQRGTISEAGRPSPFRDRGVEENLDLFRRMRAGEFPDGAHVLRAKIDMAHPNMLMRDPLLYRIRKAHHYRRGDAWCIYPMYDYAHPLEDAFEGVTHSLCSLEFETHRPLYDWVVREAEPPSRPRQIEFARLVLSYTVLSKRWLMQLVKGGLVSGWDDPRMPTIAGFRRRGVLPGSIRRFADMVGVAKANSLVDLGKLEFVLRDDLSPVCPRVLCVLDPVEVVVTNWPEDRVLELDAPLWPADVAKAGTRKLPFARRLLIDRSDFADVPPRGWHRLSPGAEVRLRHAFVIRCDAVERDPATGVVRRLLCTADLDTLGAAPKGRKVPGTIHWVAEDSSVPCEVRLYDRLFVTETPGTDEKSNFLDELNPQSLVVMKSARAEPAVASADPDTRWQFERLGYFRADPEDSRPGALVFNRIVTLKDTWTRLAAKDGPGAASAAGVSATAGSGAGAGAAPCPGAGAGPGAAAGAEPGAGDATAAGAPGSGGPGSLPVSRAPAADAGATPAGAADAKGTASVPLPVPASASASAKRAAARDDGRHAALVARGVEPDQADVLLGDASVLGFFEAAAAHGGDAGLVARWTVNEVVREAKVRPLAEIPVTPAGFAELVRMAADGTISASAAKEVFARMVREGGDPAEIVATCGLRQVSDAGRIGDIVDTVLASHAADVARYRAGRPQLLGFFVGKVLAASGGRANPAMVRELVQKRLG